MPEQPEQPPWSQPTLIDRALEALDRARSHPTLVAVVFAILAVGGVLTWRVIVPDRTPIEALLPQVTVPANPAASVVSAPLTAAVHVAGAVERPGLYELDGSARVADAVEAAGGPTSSAEVDRINLAAPIEDGTQVYVPTVGEDVPGLTEVGQEDDGDTLVDLNRADAALLESLPGIGPALAAAIVDHRTESGDFITVDDLLAVSGIGPAKLDGLRDLVEVG